ncbi:MAG: MCE family protein [Prevotella sp.]|nr:MCE family protein [Prevotella sp.]MBQ9651712.1 MCE family protein [Prevotella sp.]
MNSSKEIKIALVAVLGLLILYIGMNFLKGASLFSSDDVYYVKFDDVTGLSEASPIYADGFKVGTVKAIAYDFDHQGNIKVSIGLNNELRVPKGSSAEIVSDMLGNVKVNLLLANNPRERIMPGQMIDGAVSGGAMAKAADLIPQFEQMLPKLDSIMTSLNLLLADPAIANSLHNIEAVTGHLTTTTTQVNQLLGQLNGKVPGLLQKTDGVLTNAQTLTTNLAKVDVEGTMAKVDATVANVEQLTRELNSNEGSLGKLMRDPGLYNRMNQTVNDADSLLIDLRMRPKRYVHFSLF